MMTDTQFSDVEELTLCNFCKQKFNNSDLCPKILPCKHYFCLKCIETTMVNGRELYCVHCWKRTEMNDPDASTLQTHSPILSLANHLLAIKSNQNQKEIQCENCPVHGYALSMWCHTCHQALCRVCIIRCDHPGHQVQGQNEAKEQLLTEVQLELKSINKILVEIQKLTNIQKEFLLKVLEACTTLKACIESDIQLSCSTQPEMTELREVIVRANSGLLNLDTPLSAQNVFTNLLCEKQRLEHKYNELLLQCKLDEVVGNSSNVLDFTLLTQVVAGLQQGDVISREVRRNSTTTIQNPVLFLTNYCMTQLHSRYFVNKTTDLVNGLEHDFFGKNLIEVHPQVTQMTKMLTDKQMKSSFGLHSPPMLKTLPLYYFTIEVNNSYFGRIVIETRPDLAPKMSKNFGALCTGQTGISYKNCNIFQCWENESIITGDFESNNGRGGHSIYEEAFFMPDETKIPAVRGAVGMRRTQKRHDNLGMVGSQFRVILQEMRGFSAIFGQVVEGLDVVEKLASCGDQTGKPTKNIVITNCGKL